MLTTEHHKERFDAMADHDLLVEIAVRTTASEEHARKQNGFIEDLIGRALKMEGAVGFGKWVLGVTLTGLLLVASILGIIVAYLAQNGS